ncbi:MAG: metallophosphoesterase family protein [Nanoarchaeota archaeon]|mgnify:CR=1 FL=1
MTKIALISDIHSNLEAFKAVLNEIKKAKIRKIFCLGDIVGYGSSPNECIALIRKNKIKSVMGNHDCEAINLQSAEWFNQVARDAILWTHKQLTEANKKFLKSLPTHLKFENIFMVHGSPRDYIYEYIFPDTDESDFREFFAITKKQVLAIGHLHTQFIKKFNNKLIINPGSVGQPRDLNPKAAFCLFDTKTLKVDLKRIKYNIDKAANKIFKAGLPKFLADRLYLGG